MHTTRHWNAQSTVDHHTKCINIFSLILSDMAVFKVAEVDKTALCACDLTVNTKCLQIKMVVFQIGNVKAPTKSFKKAVSYQYTCRLSHILPALLFKCHFENVYACIQDQRDLVALAKTPNNQN